MGPEPELRADLDMPLPDAVWSGAATPFFVCGTAAAPRPIAGAELLIDGAPHPLDFQAPLPGDQGIRFWAMLPGTLGAPSDPLGVAVRATWEGGTATAELGRIEVEPAPEPVKAPGEARGGLIAICLAAFDPDLELLRRQLGSVREQSDRNWVCVISDDCSDPDRYAEIEAELAGDERFVVSRSGRRRGFYLNFERALRLAPATAEFVALCDQDDVWYPDKLAALRAAIGDAPLAYSDARLTDTEGTVFAQSLWPKRRPNTASLGSALVANSVPGASALIRADVARRALPFPRLPGWPFHDRWLPAVALSAGRIVRVDRPLYDYVQHEGAVLQGRFGAVAELRGRRRDFTPSLGARWRGRFFYGSLPLRMSARALLDREAAIGGAERRALSRLAAESPATALRLWLRSLRPLLGRNETSGLEWVTASGLIWRSLVGHFSRLDTAPPPLNLSDLAPPRWG
jgi:glycosyltransferase involved in cell wall biosynthesis